ncbi:MAG: hypothetical protein HN413_00745 [Chloroflexi bacterium]|jgi:hypothetical protein|nr:hypothetical protein [Chloroflexota bacterium]
MSELQLDKYSLHEELDHSGHGTRSTALLPPELEVPRAVKVLHPALGPGRAFFERIR